MHAAYNINSIMNLIIKLVGYMQQEHSDGQERERSKPYFNPCQNDVHHANASSLM
jgi:hypothetical protein